MFFRIGATCRVGKVPSLPMLAAMAGLLLLVTGCTVGPDYVRPSAVAPAAYKETKGWKVAEPRDDVLKGAWWEIFNDPQLNELEAQVDISNQNLAAAEAQFRLARAQVRVARAAFFPTVTAGSSVSRSLASANAIGGSRSGKASPINDYLLSGDVTWELDVWGKVRRSVESSQAAAQASAGDLEATRLSVQAELAQNYFQLRTLDAQKALLDATAAAYQKFLKVTQNRYASGVASSSDVLQAQTQLKSTQAQAIDVGVQRAQLEHAVAVLIGKPASDFSIPFSPLPIIDPPSIPMSLPSELLERRPDIAAAETARGSG